MQIRDKNTQLFLAKQRPVGKRIRVM
jgi:hypothetical protein